MLPRIKIIRPMEEFLLYVEFDDGKIVLYDMNEDIDTLPGYAILRTIDGLFQQVSVDASRTCVEWTEDIDLASDIIYVYGKTL